MIRYLNKKSFWLCFGIIVALFYGLRFTGVVSAAGLDLSAAQVVVFPLVLGLLTLFAVTRDLIPRPVLMLAFVCGILGVSFAYTYQGDMNRTFLVSKFDRDEYEIESEKFRDLINKELLDRSVVRAARFYKSFRRYREVKDFFAANPDVKALVWGNRRWVNVSFRGTDEFSLAEIGQGGTAGLVDGLMLIKSIPAIGLSYEGEAGTARFLAALFDGFLPELSDSPLGLLSPVGEVSLRYAGDLVAAWTTYSHRAYPWWVLGNHYLIQSIRGERFQPAELECAIKAYSAAGGFLPPADNPELFAALRNNLGIALLLRALLEGKPEVEGVAEDYLRSAIDTAGDRNPLKFKLKVWQVAKKNLKELRRMRKRGYGS